MSEINYFTPETAGFRNRSAMLLVLGVLFIIAGAVSGCLGLFVPLTLVIPKPPGTPAHSVSHIVIALAFYIAAAVVAITLGIGMVRKRRWAPPIILAGSWIGLTAGVLAIATFAWRARQFATAMRQSMTRVSPGTPAPPPAMINFILAVMAAFALLAYLIVPSVLIWMFRDENVRQTVAFYDPKPRWTDRLPLAVMILFLAAILAATMTAATAAQGWWPMFGAVWYGAPAIITAGVVSILFVLSAWLILRLQLSGLWLAIGLWTVYTTSWMVTVWHADMRGVFVRAGIDARQIQIMEDAHTLPDRWTALPGVLFLGVIIGFAIYARRYFGASGDGAVPPPIPQSSST